MESISFLQVKFNLLLKVEATSNMPDLYQYLDLIQFFNIQDLDDITRDALVRTR